MNFDDIPQIKGNLREHQINAKRQIFEAWNQFDSIMLQMPTGTGKTFLFTSIINDLVSFYKQNHIELNIVIVAHRTELIDQISNSLSHYGISHGFIQGNREQHLWQRVQVASIQSLLTCKNEQNVIRLDFDYIIVDEAHHSLANTYKRLFELFPKAKKLGVTATPWRLNHETFLSLYQKLITTPQISWFIDHKLLADFDYVSIKPDSDLQRMINNTEVAQTGDFVNMELDRAFNNQRIRARLFASYKKFAFGRKGIIYAINRQHAANIAAMYSSQGINAVAIDCETPKEERKYLIDLFKQGEIQILVNVDIFTEGFDCPDVNFIQLARPTRSLALYLQQVGRGLRVVEGKSKTIILDNVGLYNYFGLPDADRKWQYHFKGHEVTDNQDTSPSNLRVLTEEREPQNFDEDDEEMSVIRGSRTDKPVKRIASNEQVKNENKVEEFTLCNYYLVRGTAKNFKVYPLTKKKGVITQGIEKCQLDFNIEEQPLFFSEDSKLNMQKLAQYSKIQTVVFFSAMAAGLSLQDALNPKSCKWALNEKGNISLFDALKAINAIFITRS